MTQTRTDGRWRTVSASVVFALASVVVLTSCGRDASGPLAPEQAVLASSAQSSRDKKPTLKVDVAGKGDGKVTSTPEGIKCEHECKESFATGVSVTLTATPKDGSVFAGWTGACAGTGACTVTMSGNTSVTATFDRVPTFRLTVSTAGNGKGTVKSSPKGISCSSAKHGDDDDDDDDDRKRKDGDHGDKGKHDDDKNCRESFAQGTVVTLTADPHGQSVFTGWDGACSGTNPTCTVTMDEAKSVTATFSKNVVVVSHALTVTVGANGRVTSAPAGIDCLVGVCSQTFVSGTVVTLTAAAAPGAPPQDISWIGCPAASGSVCTLTMTGALNVEAVFVTRRFAATVALTGAGSGSVVATNPEAGSGFNCPGVCTDDFVALSTTTLTATPSDTNSAFAGWSGGGCSGAAPTCLVLMDAAKNVTANFQSSVVSVSLAGSGGAVTTVPYDYTCSFGTCDIGFGAFGPNALVTLTATASPFSDFAGWTGDCALAGPSPICSLTVDGAKSVTATFTPKVTSFFELKFAMTGGGTLSWVASSGLSGSLLADGNDNAFIPAGSTVTFTLTNPSLGTVSFVGCTSTGGSVCVSTITMDQAWDVTAAFDAATTTLTVVPAGGGGGGPGGGGPPGGGPPGGGPPGGGPPGGGPPPE